MGARHEAPATAAYLRTWEDQGYPTMHELAGGELSVNGIRSVDGAVWLEGERGVLAGSRIILVQTKAVLTSSVLGQALYTRRLAEAQGARVERSIVLCGWTGDQIEGIAGQEPLRGAVEVDVRRDLFGDEAKRGATKGAPRWKRVEREAWLGGLGPVDGLPMYPGASYDKLCAAIPLEGGGTAFVATQKSEGMSGLGRVVCGCVALGDRYPEPHYLLLAVRKGQHDLRRVAVEGVPAVTVLDVLDAETAAETLERVGLRAAR